MGFRMSDAHFFFELLIYIANKCKIYKNATDRVMF